MTRPLVSVIYPCYNEEAAIGACVDDAIQAIAGLGIEGEVVVVDNLCTDRTAEIAVARGARVVREPQPGYGASIRRGMAEAYGDYLVVLDADGTYPIEMLSDFVRPMMDGRAEFVLGNRFGGLMERDAMPFLNRYLGNPVLSGLTRLLFRVGLKDMHCGMRALRKDKLQALDLRMPGMEFATEMVVKALDLDLRVHEFDIPYRPRIGPSKLSPLRDAWRHVEYMLVFSPTFMLLVPGALGLILGLLVQVLLVAGPREILFRSWDVHTNLAGLAAALMGASLLTLGVVDAVYARSIGMGFRHSAIARWVGVVGDRPFRLAGLALALGGAAIWAALVAQWAASGFGVLAAVPVLSLATTSLVTGLLFLAGSLLARLIPTATPYSGPGSRPQAG